MSSNMVFLLLVLVFVVLGLIGSISKKSEAKHQAEKEVSRFRSRAQYSDYDADDKEER